MHFRSPTGNRRESVRQALFPLGAAAALSLSVAAIYLPIGIVVQSPGNASIYGGSVALWMLSSAIGMVSLFMVFVAARAALCRSDDPGVRPVLASYFVASIAQGVTFGFASVLFGVADSPHLAFRISGVLFQVPLIAAIGYAMSRHDAHRKVIAKLDETRQQLLAIGNQLDDELDRTEAELISIVRESLDPAMETLEDSLSAAESGGEKTEAARALDELVEQRIRPLAQKLGSDGDIPDDEVARESDARPKVPLPARFRLSDAIKPSLVVLFLVVAAIPTAARVLGPGEVALYVVSFCACVWAVLTLAKRALGSLLMRTGPGMLAMVCLYAAAGVGSFLFIGAIGIPRPSGLTGSAVAIFASMGFVFTGFMLVEARRTLSEGELEADTLRLRHAVGLIRRRARLVNRRLTFVVHGALQGALNAAALKISEAGEVTHQLADEIRGDIRDALAQIEGPTAGSREPDAPLKTSTTIDEISAVWGGRRRFGAKLDPSVQEMLSADLDTDEAVAEVIREAVNNAFRHGAARSVWVRVEEGDDSGLEAGELAVTVTDDGIGLSGSNQPGVGSALFDDLCATWTLGSEGAKTLFSANIAAGLRRDSEIGPVSVTQVASG